MGGPTMVTVQGRPVAVHQRGAGVPLLLLHGGWAGAQAHWGPVWDRLGTRHRVLAPEFPDPAGPGGPRTAAEYARWVVQLADALGLDRFALAGNSLGANVARSVAARWPERVSALVLVDGGSWAQDPGGRLLLALPGGLALVRAMARWNAWSPSALRRAFSDPGRAPPEVVRTLEDPPPAAMERMLALFRTGDPEDRPPGVPTLVIFGRQDRLIGLGVGRAPALTRGIPGARLEVIEDAGHLPQVEQPEAFVRVVEAFLGEVEARPAA
jgi:2-hydroxy-6-oxonona-2,4-dienedioate hydrolase